MEARVEDAVNTAGRFLANADSNSANLAARLEDGQQINIPSQTGSVQGHRTVRAVSAIGANRDKCSLYRGFNFDVNCCFIRQPSQYQYGDPSTTGYSSEHWPGDCTKHRHLSSTAWTVLAYRRYHECPGNWPCNV